MCPMGCPSPVGEGARRGNVPSGLSAFLSFQREYTRAIVSLFTDDKVTTWQSLQQQCMQPKILFLNWLKRSAQGEGEAVTEGGQGG